MANPQYIAHVTLTTGHVRRSPRSEVDPGILEWCRGHLLLAIEGERAAIPGTPVQCWLTAAAEARCLTASVWARTAGDDARLITIGVALHSRCGARLWEALHAHAALPLATDAGQQPGPPWVAARLEPGLLGIDDGQVQPIMSMMGDYERCLAWAWLEHRRSVQ